MGSEVEDWVFGVGRFFFFFEFSCVVVDCFVFLSNLLKSLANFVKSPPAPPSPFRNSSLKSPTLSVAEVAVSSNPCRLVLRLSKSLMNLLKPPPFFPQIPAVSSSVCANPCGISSNLRLSFLKSLPQSQPWTCWICRRFGDEP